MSEPKDSIEWDRLHGVLKDTLQKEVTLMRELLANMHQEEVLLVVCDTGAFNELFQQRALLIEKLSNLRTLRLETTSCIEKIASKEGPITEENILPMEEEITTEILSLRDQLMALAEQMNRQQSQTQYLKKNPPAPSPAPQASARAKRKAAVATYQVKK